MTSNIRGISVTLKAVVDEKHIDHMEYTGLQASTRGYITDHRYRLILRRKMMSVAGALNISKLPNPTTDLAFLPPEVAHEVQVGRYVMVGTLGASSS
jgi:hypothetical protein